MLSPLDPMIPAWLVVIILARELIVSGLRSFAESRGIEFPATWSGKIKMVIQSFTVGTSIWCLGRFYGVGWAHQLLKAAVIATLVVTVISGLIYIVNTIKLLNETQPRVPAA